MSFRYAFLCGAVQRLAATADEQNAYLESILGQFSSDSKGWGYGNIELALELEDMFRAVPDMLSEGEITQEEIAAIQPVASLLELWGGEGNADFWKREALWSDPRWDEVRAHARKTLEVLSREWTH